MDQRNIIEFYMTLSCPGEQHFHAGCHSAANIGQPIPYVTACGLQWEPGPVMERIAHVTCPACLAKLYGPTIAHLVDAVTEINTANGWRGDKGEQLTPFHPLAEIAALTLVADPVAAVTEGIRKYPGAITMTDRITAVFLQARRLDMAGPVATAEAWLASVDEFHIPVFGSKTAAIARTRLFDTESVELTEAIMADDVGQIEDELADCLIRPIDFAGAWNEEHPDRPIDIQRGVLRKLEKNRTRGYKHGGKTA